MTCYVGSGLWETLVPAHELEGSRAEGTRSPNLASPTCKSCCLSRRSLHRGQVMDTGEFVDAGRCRLA